VATTLVELSEQFDVHANQIVQWKQQAVENLAAGFDNGADTKVAEGERKELHAKIGQLTLAVDFFEKAFGKAGLPSARR